jgi:outer membrane protein assembly factor BamB
VAEVIWRTEDVRPVSAPIVVEGAVVLYTRTGQELFVTAVDPADGTELWSRPATPSQSIREVGLHLRSVDGSVAHLAPDAEGGPGSPASPCCGTPGPVSRC